MAREGLDQSSDRRPGFAQVGHLSSQGTEVPLPNRGAVLGERGWREVWEELSPMVSLSFVETR